MQPGGYTSLSQINGPAASNPLFVVHGAGGGVRFIDSVAGNLEGVRQIFAFRAAHLDDEAGWDQSFDDMAARYVRELTSSAKEPYLLAGYSTGGAIAAKMARLLQQQGRDVRLLSWWKLGRRAIHR